MCHFLYLQCDRCRWPETGTVRGVILCDEFKNHAQDRGWRAAFAEPQGYTMSRTTWRCLGLYTFIKCNGSEYDIYISRHCVRWAPDHSSYECRRCQTRESEPKPGSNMGPEEHGLYAADSNEAARSLQAEAEAGSSFNNNIAAAAAVVNHLHGASFDPADADTEVCIDWEAWIGPGPLTNMESSSQTNKRRSNDLDD